MVGRFLADARVGYRHSRPHPDVHGVTARSRQLPEGKDTCAARRVLRPRQAARRRRSSCTRPRRRGEDLVARRGRRGWVPLGTLQYVFPSKERLLRAVLEDVIDEIARVLEGSARLDRGSAHAIRDGLTIFWDELVAGRGDLQVMQYELTNYALRTPGHENPARRPYERYESIVAQ